MKQLLKEKQLIKDLLKLLESKSHYGKDKCKGYYPGCPNCNWQLLRGRLWDELDLVEGMIKDAKNSKSVQNKPKCVFCGKKMKNFIPDKGKFKGQVQKYCWVCPCRPNLVVSIG